MRFPINLVCYPRSNRGENMKKSILAVSALYTLLALG
jgi:hypothetical protein